MESDVRTQQWLHLIGLIGVTVAGLALCYLLAAPFLSAVISAVALAVVMMPIQRRIENKTRRPGIAAGVTVTLTAAFFIGPAYFVGQRLLSEANSAARLISENVQSGAWRRVLSGYPQLEPAAVWIEEQINFPRAAENSLSWLSNTAGSLVQGSGVQLFGLLITFYFLFYFLRDRRAALAAITLLSPLGRTDMSALTTRIAETIRATVYGTLTVAMIQGCLGGLMFWWLGLPTPLLWGIVMALLAIVPMLGAFIVWIPAAIILLLSGHPGQALILMLWGTLVVGCIDNLIYPALVGNRMKMHTIPTFISLVGGLLLFGAPGLILGPVILTVTMFLVQFWRGQIDQHQGPSHAATFNGQQES